MYFLFIGFEASSIAHSRSPWIQLLPPVSYLCSSLSREKTWWEPTRKKKNRQLISSTFLERREILNRTNVGKRCRFLGYWWKEQKHLTRGGGSGGGGGLHSFSRVGAMATQSPLILVASLTLHLSTWTRWIKRTPEVFFPLQRVI